MDDSAAHISLALLYLLLLHRDSRSPPPALPLLHPATARTITTALTKPASSRAQVERRLASYYS